MDTWRKTWDRFIKWILATWQGLSLDIFALTELRTIGLYLIMGLVVILAAGFFLYGHIVAIIANSVVAIQDALRAGTPIDRISAQSIVTKTIEEEMQRVNLWLVFWILLTIIVAAYILAGILLAPIRRAVKARKQLTGNVSHELRTPLSIMKINTEVMFAGDEPPTREELISCLTSSIEEVDRMTKIVNFFLHFPLGKGTEKKIELSKVDLSAVALATVKSMGGIAKEKEVALTTHDIGPVYIAGDVVTLEEMLMNLIKNSIAYTKAKGTVAITIRRDGIRKVVLSVTDTGIGIPPKDLPRIFEPFYRGENAFSQRTKRRGSGIGLAIVKEIADLHEAKISVKSELGHGTSISIAFPAALPLGLAS